jgi:hypothetical protein
VQSASPAFFIAAWQTGLIYQAERIRLKIYARPPAALDTEHTVACKHDGAL